MAVPLLDTSHVHQPIRDQAIEAFGKAIDSAGFILGKPVADFESDFVKFTGGKHAIGVSSGTDALLLAMMGLDLTAGDEIIVPTFTFFATVGCIWRTGAKPVFVDIDPITYNVDPKAIEKAITKKTKAIVPVHLFGQSADMTAIMEIAKQNNLHVIEDTAQALGAKYNNQTAGTIGSVGCFSFYPSKTLGAFGDAGCCVTNDDKLAEKLRSMRHHGQTDVYHHTYVGGNFRLDAVQAAMLKLKLAHLDEYIIQRREQACRYHKLLEGLPIETPVVAKGNFHAFNYYTIRTEKRDQLRDHLKANQIGNSVYYPLPLHLQPCFAGLGHKKGDFPLAEKASNQVISLPIFPGLTEAQQEEVAGVIGDFFN